MQCSADGWPFGVVGVHLSLRQASRLAEAAEALRDAGRLRGPLMLCGDFNEGPKGPSWAAFRRAGLVDHADPEAFTFPASAPTSRIDGLLVRGAAAVRHVVPDLPAADLAAASDHLPVLARIEIG